ACAGSSSGHRTATSSTLRITGTETAARTGGTGGHIWRAGRIDLRRRDGAGHDPCAQALKATDMSLLPPSRRWATNAWMALGTVTTCALAWLRSSLVTG